MTYFAEDLLEDATAPLRDTDLRAQHAVLLLGTSQLPGS